MQKRSRILGSIAVAAVFLSASPAIASHGPPGEPMYRYFHYDNEQLVGRADDVCTSSGVAPDPQWIWGYGTIDIQAHQWAECHAGVIEHIQY
ncbi:MAG: hypothetical protein ABWX67_14790 [Allosphingosinicella sp.]